MMNYVTSPMVTGVVYQRRDSDGGGPALSVMANRRLKRCGWVQEAT